MLTFIKKKIRGYFIENSSIPSFQKSMERIRDLGFYPKTIFDVGAYDGDFAKQCLALWNKTTVVCFEPLEVKFEALERWSKDESRVRVIRGLLGDENRENVRFNENESASSVLDEYISKDFKTAFHKMRTLDTCIEEFGLDVPNLIKIDVQGFEYQILSGFLKNLSKVDVIIAELNHIDIHRNVKLAEDVIQLLHINGFVMYDIVEIHRRPFDGAVWQTDFMFVRKDSFLRENKRWI